MGEYHFSFTAFLLIALLSLSFVGCQRNAIDESYDPKDHSSEASSTQKSYTEDDPKSNAVGLDYTITINGVEFEGQYTGILLDEKPEGDGIFTSGAMTYHGPFVDGEPTGNGTIDGYDCEIKIINEGFSGVYSGAVEAFIPHGDGTFTTDTVLYSGSFANGAVNNGTIQDLPWSVAIGENSYMGSYSGPVVSGQLTGKASFTTDDFQFDGSFSEGIMSNGTLTNAPLTITIEKSDYTGTYTGAVKDGAITGDGTFQTDTVLYTGSFDNGSLDNGIIDTLPWSVTIGESSYLGVYSGSVTSGQLTGKASFTTDDFQYDGSFAEGIMSSGTLTEFPLTVKLGDNSYTGTYTGAVKDGAITGDGVFTSETLTFDGSFKEGKPESGSVTEMSYTLKYMDISYTGTYSGPLVSQVPSGENGTFEAKANADGYYLSFSGSFDQGKLDDGTLKTNGYKAVFISATSGESYERLGTFEGSIKNGLGDGSCTFSSKNANDIPYTATGEMSEGSFQGSVERVYHRDEGDLKHVTTFEHGAPIFETYADIAFQRMITTNPTLMPIKCFEFLDQHAKEFMWGEKHDALNKLIDTSLTFDKYYSNPSKYEGVIKRFSGWEIYNSDVYEMDYGDISCLAIGAVSPVNPDQVIWVYFYGTSDQISALTFDANEKITVTGMPYKIIDNEDEYQYIAVLGYDFSQ